MSFSSAVVRGYLNVFRRPVFKDDALQRLSSACSDVNGVTIVVVVLFVLQNLIGQITSPSAIAVLLIGVAYLFLERSLIFSGRARLAVLTFGVAVGATWFGLTYLAGTVRHTQSMVLLVGLTYVTITLGIKKGVWMATFYSALLLLGWVVEYARTGGRVLPVEQMKFISAAILSLVLLTVICEILREHLVENYRLALIARDRARDELQLSNEHLTRVLKDTEGDLTHAVEVTNASLIKQHQFDVMDILVSGLSHEMATPLSNAKLSSENMIGWVQEISIALGPVTPRIELLLECLTDSSAIVRNNLARTDELLKSFKRLSLDQTGTNMRDFDLKEVIQRALFSMKPELVGINLTTDLRTIKMHSLPYAIEQIVTNLVSNAIRHGLENMPTPTVHIATSANFEASTALITVTDNGSGMSPKTIAKIFTPFFTTKKAQGGSGMGLSVVRYLSETVLGGTISLSSGTGGTQFIVSVPLTTINSWASADADNTQPMQLA